MNTETKIENKTQVKSVAPTIMLSLSGGIDSASCLYHILRAKKEIVLIHHMRMYNWCRRKGRR